MAFINNVEPNSNRKGRLVYMEDGSGGQEFKYGKMGEITELRRTMVIPNQAVATYVTQWRYDSWNRLHAMTYPDGEVVNYHYNKGGLLNDVSGNKNGNLFTYVDYISYDKFEQRTKIDYGNGTSTFYTYNPLNRLLNTLRVTDEPGNAIMNNQYTYDDVQNITKVTNSGTSANTIGGAMEHNYHYDNLYRLDSASGAFVGANGKKANYSLAMGYDNMHNITHKRQDVVQQSVKFDGILNAGYDLSYTYANNSQQIANIADASYRAERSSGMYATGSVASDSIDHKTHSYRYDANGNLLYVGTGKKINDSTLLESSTRRLLWDEDNRLLAISDNGYVSNYWYDASGERTVKQSGGSEGVFVNGVLSAARTQTSKFTAYVSPYLVVSNGGNYSKHIYVGSQRITSKLSNSGIFSEARNPLTITKANNSVEPINATDYSAKFNTLTGTIAERFDSLGVIYKGTVQSGGLITQGTTSGVTPQYFYHPDHLGSSSLITDENGLMVQHIQYVPFGEVFVEERTTSWSTPYKFNAKELDPETGLYYYHARYYDPRTSVWLSVDPLWEKYPNISSYVYCGENPVKYVDLDGNSYGPPDRIAAARLFIGDKYMQQTETPLRTNFDDAAMEYQDCSELVCRVLDFDGITKGVKHMNTTGLKKFLDNNDKFEHSMNSPQVGDIALWKGHTGIVTDVDKEGNIILTHAKSTKDGVVEESSYKSPSQITKREFFGYYRPKKETPDGKVNVYGGKLEQIEIKPTLPSNSNSNQNPITEDN